MSLKRLCKKPGCRGLAIYPNKYCTIHQYLQREEEERKNHFPAEALKGNYQHLYTDTRWKLMSSNFLRLHPICAICGDKATEVHHDYIEQYESEDKFFDEDHLVPLCHNCHMKVTAEQIAQRNKVNNEKIRRDKRIGKLWY